MSLNTNVAYDDILEEGLELDFFESIAEPQLVVLKGRSDAKASSVIQSEGASIAISGCLCINP